MIGEWKIEHVLFGRLDLAATQEANQTTGVAPNQTICRQSSKQTCRQPPVPTPAGGEETRQQPPTRTVGSIKIYVRCERLIYMCYCLSALIPLVSVAVALAPLNLLWQHVYACTVYDMFHSRYDTNFHYLWLGWFLVTSWLALSFPQILNTG